jgi:hypothetical protein
MIRLRWDNNVSSNSRAISVGKRFNTHDWISNSQAGGWWWCCRHGESRKGGRCLLTEYLSNEAQGDVSGVRHQTSLERIRCGVRGPTREARALA